MIAFPPAKINLGLNVLRRRDDGYHDIESVLFAIPLCDVLDVIIDPAAAPNTITFDRSGIAVPGDPEHDLCVQAVRMLQKEQDLPGLRAHLHKVIPTGAGLGGGSSDAAQMLKLVYRLCDLDLPKARTVALASALGSDVPFFLEGGARLAQGRGEVLSPVKVDLRGKWLMLVNPGVHVPTAEVYRHMRPSGRSVDLRAALAAPLIEWKERVVNAMEPYVFSAYPTVAAVKEAILGLGATYAAMSGSGSTVFGLFEQRPPASTWPADHRCWTFAL